jgi:hypothetical protein
MLKQNDGKKNTKNCCYMDRECTPKCVAYSISKDVNKIAEGLELSNMHCIRLLMELTDLMKMQELMAFEDFEDEDIF